MKISKKLTVMGKKRMNILWKKHYEFGQSFWFSKLTRGFIKKGRGEFAENIMLQTILLLKNVTQLPHLAIFNMLSVIKPIFLLRWIRRSKMYFNIPKMVTPIKQYKFSVFMVNRYILITKFRSKIKSHVRLFNEVLLVAKPNGGSTLIEFRNDVYNVAIFNRARARFTW